MPAEVRVVDDFVAADRLARLYGALRAWPEIPHGLFWIDVARVERHAAGDPSPAAWLAPHVGELAGPLLDILVGLVDLLPAACRGGGALELWTKRVDEVADRVFLHRDTHSGPKPEGAPARPLAATILHVGPDRPLAGGDTVFAMDDPPSDALIARDKTRLEQAEVWSLARSWLPVPRRAGRLVVFDGARPHFVAPLAEPALETPRITLLVNAWAERPVPAEGDGGSPCLVRPDEFRALCRMRTGEMRALVSLLHRIEVEGDELAAMVSACQAIARRMRRGQRQA